MELEMRMIRRTEYTMKKMALELAMGMGRKTEQMALELTMELAMRMIRPTNLTFRGPLYNERHGTGTGNENGTKNGTDGTGIDDGTSKENDATNQPDIQISPTQ